MGKLSKVTGLITWQKHEKLCGHCALEVNKLCDHYAPKRENYAKLCALKIKIMQNHCKVLAQQTANNFT